MTAEPENNFAWSSIVGDLQLPPAGEQVPPPEREKAARPPDPDEKVAMLIELNARYPGGLASVRKDFYDLWDRYVGQAGGRWPATGPADSYVVQPRVPDKLAIVAPTLYQCVLSRAALRDMVEEDRLAARKGNRPPAIYRVWPDYTLYPHIDRSAPTVKADAAWRSYDARGRGIVWAVIDSGIEASHEHFSALELFQEAKGEPLPEGLTSYLHRDFSYLVNPDAPDDPGGQDGQDGQAPASGAAGGAPPAPDPISALSDPYGHGTHVAGIIAGCSPSGRELRIAQSKDPNGGYVPRAHAGVLSGMAPACQLVSIKVTRRSSWGRWVTSSSAVIRALYYLQTEVNINPDVLRVHGVNISLGCGWQPDNYAAGQSPLCRAVNQLVASGVVVVISAGNSGASSVAGDAAGSPGPSAVMGSISEPAHAEDCIAVGSTHRDAPHAFGVTWTSAKGPTLDGRMKPDVVAPGEWITSAAVGEFRSGAGLDPKPRDRSRARFLTYAEESGTSMAAPHVSGIIAAFLSARPEFIGRPRQVKELLTTSATNLGREPYAQGAGLVDLMRMLANV